MNLQDLLEAIAVDGPEDREYAIAAGNTSWPKGWYAVSDENSGCIAYFQFETDAFAFRLWLINARLNDLAARYEAK